MYCNFGGHRQPTSHSGPVEFKAVNLISLVILTEVDRPHSSSAALQLPNGTLLRAIDGPCMRKPPMKYSSSATETTLSPSSICRQHAEDVRESNSQPDSQNTFRVARSTVCWVNVVDMSHLPRAIESFDSLSRSLQANLRRACLD